MALVFRFAARSDAGVVRSKNDDSGYAGRFFACVADGMGGHAGGDVASASTVLDLAHLDTRGFAEPDTVLPDEIQTANAFLSKLVEANPKLAGMGTTITAILITEDRMQFAHIGDSRAYRLKKSRFRQVSKDHTFVQRLVDEGRLDPDQAEYHPHKNVLMRVLGDVDASPELDITSFPVEAGERWLLCSDGLNAVVSDRLIEQKLRSTQSLESIVDDLVDLTIEGGAPDNVTVTCMEVVEADEQDLTPDDGGLPLSRKAVAAASGGYGAMPETPDDDAESSAEHAGSPEDTMRLVPVVNPEALSGLTPDEDELSPLSAAMLGQDQEVLPHSLVGAAASASETGMIPMVPRNVDEHPMAALLTGQPLRPVRHTYSELLGESPNETGEQETVESAARPEAESAPEDPGTDEEKAAEAPAPAEDPEAEELDPEDLEDWDDEEMAELSAAIEARRRRRAWFLPTFVTLLAILIAVVASIGYIWTQTQYYVGEDDGEVAIFNGVSQELGPLHLSEVDQHMELATDDLTPYHHSRVANGIPADDRAHAETIVEQLRETVEEEAAEEAEENGEGSADENGGQDEDNGGGDDDGEQQNQDQNDEQAGENSE
ncbi:PP2C family protein-serine/threonine phosphatase [Nesterenkonia cremea]|uniref:PPM-type phosphatase domain-containing protein n=1 Tax=Nesterenkonia cremea TaxID=1882340 RepID=A0A917AJU3_9MICC|nr:protein phosphatase 2C domain-containing protein [Nesterenkonia cremea]GGE58047.1 hypothetical protein GCM10011401_01000 [Nesterenkonia cremea]